MKLQGDREHRRRRSQDVVQSQIKSRTNFFSNDRGLGPVLLVVKRSLRDAPAHYYAAKHASNHSTSYGRAEFI
jgi:hypothetical protein